MLTTVRKNKGIKHFAKRLVGRLPWGFRKSVAFVGAYGLVNLLASRPSFVGIYRSFDEAPRSRQKNNEYLVDGATLNLDAQKFDDATGLPLLRNSHSLLPLTASMLAGPNPIRILDVGGAGGVDFANLLNATSALANIQYQVVDLPEVCALGRRHWVNDQRISFAEAMPSEANEFDLIYSSWAVQYFAEPLQLVERLTAYRAKAILLINVPFTTKGAFVRMQINKMIRSWVLNLPDVERIMRCHGYVLSFHAGGDVDHNVDNYPPEYRVSNVSNLLFLRA